MRKIILISLCLFFVAQAVAAQEKDGYKKFLEQSTEDFKKNAEKTNKDYNIGSYSRWDVDQETGELIFSENGVSKVIAKVQIAGSYSKLSHTWKWSWDNKTVYDLMKKDMGQVKDYGEKNQFKELTTPIFQCEEDYAWVMTAAAGSVLKAKGAYRGPIDSGYAYFLIMDIKWADAGK